MEAFYKKKEEEVLEALKTDGSKGLSSAAARERLEEYGANELAEGKKKTLGAKLLDQFKDVLVLILIAASVISFFVGEGVDALVIIAIVILNAALGLYQESRAEEAVLALRKMASPTAKVLRDGVYLELPSRELVPGDVVELETGDIVPADMRLTESVNLKIDESSFTGESVAAEKDARAVYDRDTALADRANMAYSSSIVTYGHGRGIVTATGEETEIGKIATTISSYEEEATPLQRKLAVLGRNLGFLVLIVCAVVFIAGYLHGNHFLEMFMTSVALAVAAVPEGLPAIVTIVLSLGMRRMATRNAIVKKLLAVETLGTTTFIASDKTGTLTKNEMTVKKIYVDDTEVDVTGTGYELEGDLMVGEEVLSDDKLTSLYTMLVAATLCNDAKLVPKDGRMTVFGDPTEGALLTVAGKKGLTAKELAEAYPRIEEIPFDSDRKLMSTFHTNFIEGKIVQFVKGAPDEVLKRSTTILTNRQNLPLDEARKQAITDENTRLARGALRVLAFAFRVIDAVPKHPKTEIDEQNLIFLGLMGMIDPPREEVVDAIALCRKAGIVPMMITGDYLDTAIAIGKDLGMITDESEAVMGSELDKYTDEELVEHVPTKKIFARVSPEHKVRIVTALRTRGEIVAMTGDGVNDAPAIKKADIGISMGITGTDVAKNTADVILTDDNFATIVHAVEEGRVIYANIKKFVKFLLSCNIGEVLIVLVAILADWDVPFLPIQLLWLNLVTDSFPALALGVEPGAEDIMNVPPRRPDEPILDGHTITGIAVQSLTIAAATLVSYRIGMHLYSGHLEGARTIALVTLILAELLRSYSIRSDHFTLVELGVFTNKALNYGVGFSFLVTLLVLYVPAFAKIFRFVTLGLTDWLIILPLAFLPLVAGEVYKSLRNRRRI